MKKRKEYKFKIKRGPILRFFRRIICAFKRKPEIVNLSGEALCDKAIYLSNHAGANGPLTYECFFPKSLTAWGTQEMTGNFKSRWNYLYHVFYMQKLHWGKFKSFIVASLFAPISKICYNAVGLIATYRDNRFIYSAKTSCKVLDKNAPLLIFPEDSDEGYMDPPLSFNKGFVLMAKLYKKIRGQDIPVYVCYFNSKAKRIVVSKPIFVNKMLDSGMSEEQVADEALKINHNIFNEYILKKIPAKI